VTALGGSEFTGDSPNSTTSNLTDAPANLPFWSGTSGGTDTISSALIYIPETTWNDTSAAAGLSATGGGVSTKFSKPAWQNALTPADTKRDVPDVTLSASPAHDSTLICSQGSCVNGFRAADGSLNVVGGTSVGAPAFSGILAILNQATTGPLGNVNLTLYPLAVSTPTAFHDITTGNNIVPCTQGSTGCPASAPFQIGFSAGTGYDLVTGLGSINANVLVTSWPTFASAPDFSIGGSPVTVPAPGQSGTSTITVSMLNGFSGTVTLTCSGLPVGASCAFVQGSLTTSGTSTLTITTNSNTPLGTSTFTVTGTSGSTVHNTSVSLTVASPGFAITAPALAPASVAAGASATSTITVTPSGGFTGSVALACAVTGGGSPAPSCTFSANPVANGSGASTLTVHTTAGTSLSGALKSPGSGRGFGWLAASSGALFAGIFFLGVPDHRRRRLGGLGLMLLVFFAAGAGCGGGNSNSGGSTKTGATPAGTYTVTVTATSGSLSPQTKALVLVVQ